MLTKSKAIVLHSLKYGEASLIVDVLTEEQGRISFVVRIPKTSKARVKKQLFQPLTLLEIEYDYRERSSLQRLRDARLSLPYYINIQQDPSKLAEAFFLSEFLGYATRDEQQNKPLFLYIERSLEWLDAAKRNFANFHLVFLIHLSGFIGFFPNLDNFTEGCYFDLREGRFVTSVPLHSDFLQPLQTFRLAGLMRMNFDNMHLFRMSRVQRQQILDVILQYYRLHIPQMPELRSVAVLQELFD